ncbi:unnamed protein product [Trichogramma brassicae]|uniref:Reverse transcriptase domain-containing protein n=1 Tax=Trichogramma brassicae TaxID=86971 RepID=A0A6H5IXS8_9HYME|nr:unnamed protein product [Trichogramma brassicae]
MKIKEIPSKLNRFLYSATPTHRLAKILYEELKSRIKRPASQVTTSMELKKLIGDYSIPEDYVLLSLDVSALFTNVSLELVLASLDKRWHTLFASILPFDVIRDLTIFLFENTYFVFNDIFYRQKYGTPMGSPISQLFADVVMDDLETFCLSELKKHQCNPIFYFRYVDDTVICVKREHIDLVLKTFNVYDKNLQFTHEIEKDGALNFLDISLIRDGSGLITDWYRKPTNTTRILAFDSRHTAQQKKNIVFNLVDRAVLLADHRFHNKNLIYVKNILRLNGYPEKFSNENISLRLREIKHRSGGRVRRLSDSEPLRVIQLPWINGFFPRCQSMLKRYGISTLPVKSRGLASMIRLGKDKMDKMGKNGGCLLIQV